MKTRLVTAGVGLLLWAVVLFFFKSIVLNIIVAAFAVLGVYEILLAKKLISNRLLTVFCMSYAAAIPFLLPAKQFKIALLVTAVFLFILLCLLLKYHETLSASDITFAFIMTIIITGSFVLVVISRFFDQDFDFLYCMVMLGVAWLSDAGAYFIGVFFGKHKLAPKISPKKTIEGAVGGLLTGILGLMLGAFIAKLIISLFGINVEVNYLVLAFIGMVGSVAGLFGDLFFSVIKRQNGLKDFGTIFPGHGGILDRFDSVIFAVPFVALIFYFQPFLTVIQG